MLDVNSNLVGILKGPTSGSGTTEVHTLNAADQWSSWLLETGTGLGLTYGSGEDWDFALNSAGDLFGILKGPVSGSGKTELHVLTAASNYQTYSLQIGTGMGYTSGGGEEWEFMLNAPQDLVGVLKGPVSGSGKTELHILSAASNYESYSLQVGTGMGYSTGADWTFQMDGQNNLVGILKGPVTGSGKTEVHTLTASSNYMDYKIQTGTALGIADDNWDMTCRWNAGCDLYGILKGPATGSAKTEIHAVTSASNYQTWAYQVATGSGYTSTACGA